MASSRTTPKPWSMCPTEWTWLYFLTARDEPPPEYAVIPAPRAVYVGALDDWFDVSLVGRISNPSENWKGLSKTNFVGRISNSSETSDGLEIRPTSNIKILDASQMRSLFRARTGRIGDSGRLENLLPGGRLGRPTNHPSQTLQIRDVGQLPAHRFVRTPQPFFANGQDAFAGCLLPSFIRIIR